MIAPARTSARTYFSHAAVFAGLAAAVSLLPEDVRLGRWVPYHLGFTGAATLGVAGASTFFLGTLRGAPVPSAGTRIAHVLWHEAGVAALVAGRIIGVGTLVTVGGGMFVGSILWMAGVIVWQVRGSQHRRWDAQPAAYLVALSLLAAGAVLGVLLTTVPPAGGYGAHVS